MVMHAIARCVPVIPAKISRSLKNTKANAIAQFARVILVKTPTRKANATV